MPFIRLPYIPGISLTTKYIQGTLGTFRGRISVPSISNAPSIVTVVAQTQPRKPVLDHAGYTAPTRQHELNHTDHTDHTDQESIYLPWNIHVTVCAMCTAAVQ